MPIGHKHSEETKRKMRLKQLGENNSFFGKKHTIEAKIKIRSAMKGITLNEKAHNWKGDDVGYSPLHTYVKRHLPRPELCQICKQKKKLDLANATGIYKRDFKNWMYICRSCHWIYDDHYSTIPKNDKGRFIRKDKSIKKHDGVL